MTKVQISMHTMYETVFIDQFDKKLTGGGSGAAICSALPKTKWLIRVRNNDRKAESATRFAARPSNSNQPGIIAPRNRHRCSSQFAPSQPMTVRITTNMFSCERASTRQQTTSTSAKDKPRTALA